MCTSNLAMYMRHFFTLFILLTLGHISFSQTAPFTAAFSNDEPEFDQFFLQRNHIKAIHVKSYVNKDQPVGAHISGTYFEFDSTGNLVQQVDIQREDTSQILDYDYNDRGLIRWKFTENKLNRKTYKSGYRFNENKKIFQVKSYEMLSNDALMLIESRQYVYDVDSNLVAILCMQNDQLVQKHVFERDEKGRVIKETFSKPDGEVRKEVSYTYNSKNQLISIITTIANQQAQEYQYVYNNEGKPLQVRWLENEEQRGIVDYTYNEKGFLTRMNRITSEPGSEKSLTYLQVYEYETH